MQSTNSASVGVTTCICAPQLLGDHARIARLVELRAFVEAAGEGLEPRRCRARRERGDEARIEAAAQVGADRHVAAHLQPHRVLEQPAQPLDEVRLAVVGVDLEARLPVAHRADACRGRGRRPGSAPGSSLRMPANIVRSPTHVLEGQVVAHAVEIGLGAHTGWRAAP